MKLKYIFATFTLAISQIAQIAWSDWKPEYLFSDPMAQYTIGSGVDINFPLRPLAECYEYDGFQELDFKTSGSTKSVTIVNYISDYRAYMEKLGIDVSVQANVKFARWGAGVKGGTVITQETHLAQDSVAIVIETTADYGRLGVTGLRIKEPFQELIASGRHAEFIQKCGTHFSQSAHRKSAVFVVILLERLTNKEIDDIKNSLSINANVGVLTGGVDANLTKLKSLIQNHANSSVTAFTRGGDGLPSLSGIVSLVLSGNLEQLKPAMDQALGSMDSDRSPYSQFVFNPISIFDGNLVTLIDNTRAKNMKSLYFAYTKSLYDIQRSQSEVHKLEAFSNTIDPVKTPELRIGLDGVIKGLKACQTTSETLIEDLSESIESCISDPKSVCNFSTVLQSESGFVVPVETSVCDWSVFNLFNKEVIQKNNQGSKNPKKDPSSDKEHSDLMSEFYHKFLGVPADTVGELIPKIIDGIQPFEVSDILRDIVNANFESNARITEEVLRTAMRGMSGKRQKDMEKIIKKHREATERVKKAVKDGQKTVNDIKNKIEEPFKRQFGF